MLYIRCLLILAVIVFFSCNNNEKTQIKKSNHDTTDSLYNAYDSVIKKYAKKYSIDWILIKAIIVKESHFDKYYISTTGAVGLMQLMPRKGSYFTQNYTNYTLARKSKYKKYLNYSDSQWAEKYRQELNDLLLKYSDNPELLYKKDRRFNPEYNIEEGTSQFTSDYKYFRGRGHGDYTATSLALASYNAGRGAVLRDRKNPKYDAIPINRQTEIYVGFALQIYEALKYGKGNVTPYYRWVLGI